MAPGIIKVLSDQNGDFVRHMSFNMKNIICSPKEYTPREGSVARSETSSGSTER